MKITLALMSCAFCTVAAAQVEKAPIPPPDVKIETVSIAPGIYMLVGRGGNIGLSVGVDGAAIIGSSAPCPRTDRR